MLIWDISRHFQTWNLGIFFFLVYFVWNVEDSFLHYCMTVACSHFERQEVVVPQKALFKCSTNSHALHLKIFWGYRSDSCSWLRPVQMSCNYQNGLSGYINSLITPLLGWYQNLLGSAVRISGLEFWILYVLSGPYSDVNLFERSGSDGITGVTCTMSQKLHFAVSHFPLSNELWSNP